MQVIRYPNLDSFYMDQPQERARRTAVKAVDITAKTMAQAIGKKKKGGNR